MLPSSTERNAMTSLHRNRIHGWIIPAIASLAFAFALAMPGLARADDTSQTTAATPVTATTAPAPASTVAGTDDSSANSVATPATSSTDDTTSTTDDTSSTDTTTSTTDDTSATDSTDSTDPSDWGGVAQPDAASWR